MQSTSLSMALDVRNELERADEQAVFTNGCFDLLHAGHVHILHEASEQGDHLFVGLNSDASISRLKGSNRPILPEEDRVALLSSMEVVDDVIVFESDTPNDLIQQLKPDVLVKGADYSPSEIVGSDVVKSQGGRVHRVELLEGKSTSQIIQKIKNL